MNRMIMDDEKIKDLVRQACDERSRRFSDHTPSFQQLWERARSIPERETSERSSTTLWLRRALVPALAIVAIVYLVRHQKKEPLPMIETSLQLPTDGLLMAAQNYQLKLPTDSLIRRTK